jgi:hypothetical protein
VNSRVLAIAVVAAALVLGAGWYLIGRPPAPAPAAPEVARSETAAPAPDTPVPAPAAPRARTETAPRTPAAPEPEAPPPAPTKGTLVVDSDVAGAEVFFDRQLVGRAPVTINDINPGPHRLNVSAEGFDGFADTIEIAPGKADMVVKLREVRLDTTIAVTHKHRIGSCKGQLTATPAGLRYVTSDKDDGFTAPLSDLEAFEVDYLEKNLRVKLRGGKQLNFTDPEGNADRLFVFHRDVTKVRERLARGDTPANE